MRQFWKKRPEIGLDNMFETRTEAWAAAGLELKVNEHEVKQAQRRVTLLIAMLAGVIFGHVRVEDHFDQIDRYNSHHPTAPHHSTWPIGHTPLTIFAVVLLIVLGWLISRDVSRIAPALFRRMDPGTAGTVEFLIRLVLVTATVFGALGIAGISPQALAVGGAFTAVVLGLAAQQTLGNLFAGLVLLSARPFRLGERVRLQAGALAGQLEGIVSSLGLLYTTLARGDDRIMIPNNVVLAAVVVPLREPEAVDVKVRLNSGVSISHVQELLDANITIETRATPSVVLEEIDGDTVAVRVRATPDRRSEGAKLADEIIAALAAVTREEQLDDQSDGAGRFS